MPIKVFNYLFFIMPKHGFYDYDNLQLFSKYSHVVIFGLQSLSLFWLQPLLRPLEYKYDYR